MSPIWEKRAWGWWKVSGNRHSTRKWSICLWVSGWGSGLSGGARQLGSLMELCDIDWPRSVKLTLSSGSRWLPCVNTNDVHLLQISATFQCLLDLGYRMELMQNRVHLSSSKGQHCFMIAITYCNSDDFITILNMDCWNIDLKKALMTLRAVGAL